MKKLKKVLVCMICLIILLAIIILLMTIMAKKEEPNDDVTPATAIVQSDNIDISFVKDESEYYTIERVVKQYSTYLNYLNINVDQMAINITDKESKEKISKEYLEKGENILKNILVSKYLENSNWENNILKYSNKKLSINEMKKGSFNNMNIYLININFDQDETAIVIINDNANNTFSILPSEYLIESKIDQENLLNVLQELNIKTIEKNDNNEVKKLELTDEQICIQYYYDYMDMLKNDVDKLYSKLDKNYREKRFGSLENFRQYVDANKDSLSNSTLSKYQINTNGDYIQYICLDENENYYIFNATAVMQYTLFLDTYTVDLPEFTEKYNKASEQEKVALNINKIMTAIDAKDYKYVYSKLADSFKNNYFENEEVLREYLEENLIEESTITYNKFSKEGNLYTYEILMSKGTMSSYEEIKMNIVMQLNEGTDFVMSFSIEE